MSLTREQIENIQINHGILFKNYGTANQKMLMPLRGGTSFKVEREYRDIEYDGQQGKTKGLKVIDSENASITAKTINQSMETFADKTPGAKITKDSNGKITRIESKGIGIIEEDEYAENITMFGQKVNGKYVKCQIINGLDDNSLEAAAVQKAEGEIEMVFSAHHDYVVNKKPLWSIEEIEEIEMPKEEVI